MDITDPLLLFGTILSMYIALSLTLNLEFGFTGLPNFGKVLFVAAGGMLSATVMYRVALVLFKLHSNDIFESSPRFSSTIDVGLASNPVLATELLVLILLVGAVVGAALGYLASYPAIRLREDYLGMLLLGAGELFALLTAYYPPIAGGPENLTTPDLLVGFGSAEKYVILVVFAVVAVFIFFYAERVAKSPLGRTLKAVRDNEIASEALGKDNINIRRKMLMISSALSGIIGALWILYWSQIGGLIGGDVGGTFPRLLFTFYPFTIVILGGIASNYGVVLGAVALTTVYVGTTELLPTMVTAVNISGQNANLLTDFINSTQYIILGTLVIVVLLVRAGGIIPEKPSYPLRKSKLKEMASAAGEPPPAPEKPDSEPVKA